MIIKMPKYKHYKLHNKWPDGHLLNSTTSHQNVCILKRVRWQWNIYLSVIKSLSESTFYVIHPSSIIDEVKLLQNHLYHKYLNDLAQ